MGYELERWHDFFVMLGGAAAALAGLVFVGLSVHAREVARHALNRTRARNLIVGNASLVLVAALALIPGQSTRLLGVEILIAGILVGILFLEPWIKWRPQLDAATRARTLLANMGSVFSILAGISLVVGHGGGLYLLMPSVVIGVVTNVIGAWSLLLRVADEA